MIAGIIALNRVAPPAVALWTPLNMATVPQIYLDAQDSAITDASGFASAISNLGAMGSNGDFSQATAGSRPAILDAELSGKRVLSFDGADDVLLGNSTAQKDLFRNIGHAWVFTVYKKRAAATALKYLFYASSNSASARFSAQAASPSTGRPYILARRLDADSLNSLNAPADVVGYYAMTMNYVNYSTRAAQIVVDGSVVASTATLTTSAGNTSNTASSSALSIGALVGGSSASDIDLAAMVVSNTAPSAGDIDKLFGWAAHKYGLTANLPGGHPYKTTPPTL